MKRLSRLACLAFAASLVAAPAAPQEGAPPMGAPEQMQDVAFMVGTWKTDDFQWRMQPGDEFQSSPATMTVDSLLDGCAQRTRFESELMGMTFKGHGILTFNRTTGQWQNSWLDNMGAYQSLTRGELADGTLVLSGEDVYQGEKFLMRDTTTKISDTRLDWQMELSMDAGKTWFTSLKASYTRH